MPTIAQPNDSHSLSPRPFDEVEFLCLKEEEEVEVEDDANDSLTSWTMNASKSASDEDPSVALTTACSSHESDEGCIAISCTMAREDEKSAIVYLQSMDSSNSTDEEDDDGNDDAESRKENETFMATRVASPITHRGHAFNAASTMLRTTLNDNRPALPSCSDSYLRSETYLARRNKRGVALKNLRSSFRKVVETSATSITTPVPLAVKELIGSIPAAHQASAPRKADKSDSKPHSDGVKADSHAQIQPPAGTVSTLNRSSFIQPDMYQCLRDELNSTYELIEQQTRQIQTLKTLNSCHVSASNSGNSDIMDLQLACAKARRQLTQLQVNRAWEEFQWRKDTSEKTEHFQKQIFSYNREVLDWRDRFESAKEEHQGQIHHWQIQTAKCRRELAESKTEVERITKLHRYMPGSDAVLEETDLQTHTESTDDSISIEEEPLDSAANKLGKEKNQQMSVLGGLKQREQSVLLKAVMEQKRGGRKSKSGRRKRVTWRKFLSK